MPDKVHAILLDGLCMWGCGLGGVQLARWGALFGVLWGLGGGGGGALHSSLERTCVCILTPGVGAVTAQHRVCGGEQQATRGYLFMCGPVVSSAFARVCGAPADETTGQCMTGFLPSYRETLWGCRLGGVLL
jgi:hypothetical protein